MPKRVLDVGNCGYDHASLSRLVQREFDAETEIAHSLSEALSEARTGQYALIIVNRVLDHGGDGLGVIQALKEDEKTKDIPVMLLSNYPDYQEKAAAIGAVPGFGKSSLQEPETKSRLAKFLS